MAEYTHESGFTYSEDELQKYASEANMSVEEFISSKGLTLKEDTVEDKEFYEKFSFLTEGSEGDEEEEIVKPETEEVEEFSMLTDMQLPTAEISSYTAPNILKPIEAANIHKNQWELDINEIELEKHKNQWGDRTPNEIVVDELGDCVYYERVGTW